MARLAGKICLVTGGAGAIGRAIARRFVAEGGTVFISDLPRADGEGAARETGATFLAQDVSDESRWDQVVDHIASRHGRLDVLVNNAGWEGPTERGGLLDVSLEDWRRVQAINVEGTWLGCRAALRTMPRTGGGSIVNLSSIAALMPTDRASSYGVSKAGVKQLTMSVAKAGAPDGIRCNAIHPGQIDTRMLHDLYAGMARRAGVPAEALAKDALTRIPSGRLGQPDDIAQGALYLASDESSYVTGISLLIDGGALL